MTGAAALDWAGERRRWSRFYVERLAAQLRQAVALMDDAPPHALRPHFDSYISLLNATAARSDLVAPWLALVDRLHPQPVRWGQWAAWLVVLQRAAAKAAAADQPARQAAYLAYAADLRLKTGQFSPALEVAQAALQLARAVQAAWPLGVAGAVAAAALRAMARYEEAQALIQQTQAIIKRSPSPRSPARAVMATVLLDLEQMDLHRTFKRLDAALALGQSLIARLSAVAEIDPHDLADAYVRRATIIWVSGQYEEAADDLQRAAALFRQAGDPLQATFAEANLGTVYYSLSRYGPAETYKLAAIRAAEEVNARAQLVSEFGDLSTIYIALGRMETALDYTNRMIALATELGNDAELSRGRGNRGYVLMGLGRYDEALADITFGLQLYRQQGRLEGTIITTVDLVLYLRGTGRAEEAAQLARDNYDAAWRETFPHLHIVTARCLALVRPPAEQETLLRQALTLAQAHRRPLDVAGCLFSLSAVAADAGERAMLFRQGAALLEQMDCTGWLVGRSPADPPLLPMII
jgi:tetratricopeptide (TPR) repeat protein